MQTTYRVVQFQRRLLTPVKGQILLLRVVRRQKLRELWTALEEQGGRGDKSDAFADVGITSGQPDQHCAKKWNDRSQSDSSIRAHGAMPSKDWAARRATPAVRPVDKPNATHEPENTHKLNWVCQAASATDASPSDGFVKYATSTTRQT